MKIKEHIISLLTRIRDSRLLWDVMGSVYNRRIYAAIAGLYDYVESELQCPAGASLLDAGSGRGYIALQLARKNPDAKLTGIDYSPMQVREAQKLRRQRNIPNCSFEQGNVMNIRFADHTFDAAVSIGSIKHWPDAVRGLGEIRRALKPGGTVIISETDQGASEEDIRRFINRFKVWFVPDHLLLWGLQNVIFGRSFTQESLAEAVGKAGFQHIECPRVPAVPYVIVKARKQM